MGGNIFSTKYGPNSTTPDEVWGEAFAVNVTGMFRLCRAAIPVLADGASIVTVDSENALVPRANAADPDDTSRDAGLLQHLTHDRIVEHLARIDDSAGQHPLPLGRSVGHLDEQQPLGADHNRADRGHVAR